MSAAFVRVMPALFVVLWASGFIGAAYAMPYAEPFTFLFARFAIAFAILAAVVGLLKRPRLPLRLAFHAAVAGGLLHGIYLGFAFWAIRHGLPAGLCALIVSLQPVLVSIFAGVVLDETVSVRQWLGMGLGLLGTAIVLSPGLGIGEPGVTFATVGTCIVALVAISSGTLYQKRFVTKADLISGTMWQYAGAALVTSLPALFFETGVFQLNAELVFAMAWLVLVLSFGAVFLLMAMIARGEVSKVSSLFYLVPAVTAVMAWALFGEDLSAVQIGGMALSAAGVALATRQASAARRLASR